MGGSDLAIGLGLIDKYNWCLAATLFIILIIFGVFDLGFKEIITLFDQKRLIWTPKSATLRSWTGLTLLCLSLLTVVYFLLECVLECGV